MSRTKNVLKNTQVNLVFFILSLILSFVSRAVFIQNLGTEFLGMMTVITNLFGFLNLAELGIAVSVTSALYVPLRQQNHKVITEIITVQGWLYRKVAMVIFVFSMIILLFLPYFFISTNIPLIYIYLLFIVVLIGTLLSYLVNYTQILLTADMKGYKVAFVTKSSYIVKTLLQIVAVKIFEQPFVYWLLIEFVFIVISTCFLHKMVCITYPWLLIQVNKDNIHTQNYQRIIRDTKLIFVHQIAGVMVTNLMPLVIYLYTTLSELTMYQNYMTIIVGVTLLLNTFSKAIEPSIGNLVADSDKLKQVNFLYEFSSIWYLIVGGCCFILFYQTDLFILLWLGKEFVLEQLLLCSLLFNLFIQLTRTFDPFMYAYKLFGDIWAPIAEGIIAVGMGLILGYSFGLVGVVWGTSLSLLIIVFCWKPYLLYKKGFQMSIFPYVKNTLLNLFCLVCTMTLSHYIVQIFMEHKEESYLYWFVSSSTIGIVYLIIGSIIFSAVNRSFRQSLIRVKYIVFKR